VPPPGTFSAIPRSSLRVDRTIERQEPAGAGIAERRPPGTDFTPLLRGLPQDQCQSPHWGYVLRGSIHLRYANGDEELTQAGEVFYWPGGHTGWTEEGTTFLEFSPADQIKPVLEHVQAQMAR
jgi:hypothetical protein